MDANGEGPPAKKLKVEGEKEGGVAEAKLQEILLNALQKKDKEGGGDNAFGNLLKEALQKVQSGEAQQEDSQEKKARVIPEEYPAEFVIAAVHATNLYFNCTLKEGKKLCHALLWVSVIMDLCGEGRIDSRSTCKPEFTHQVFTAGENILGYEDLGIDVYYSPRMRMYVNETHGRVAEHKLVDKLPLEQISKSCVKPRMKGNYTVDEGTFKAWLEKEKTEELLGKEVARYSVKDTSFAIHLSSLSSADEKALFDRLQASTIWSIENSSTTDLDNESFELYTLYDVTGGKAIAGFAITFMFTNPILTATPNFLRICQVVVLPSYRKQGHCRRMIKAIYATATSKDAIYEVSVEDPCPGFTRVRDVVDMGICQGLEELKDTSFEKGIVDKDTLEKVRKKAKLTAKQVQRCYEVMRYQKLDQSNEANVKEFRLNVKRRLRVERAEDLDYLKEKDEVKKKLAEMYEQVKSEYDELLRFL